MLCCTFKPVNNTKTNYNFIHQNYPIDTFKEDFGRIPEIYGVCS